MTGSVELDAAALQARMAREKLQGTAHLLQARLNPTTLLDETVDTVRTGASDLVLTTREAARRQPGLAAGAVAAGVLLLLRKPLWRLVRRRPRNETDAPPRH